MMDLRISTRGRRETRIYVRDGKMVVGSKDIPARVTGIVGVRVQVLPTIQK